MVAYEAKRQGMDVAILDLPASIERHRIDDLPHFTLDAKEPDSVEYAIAQAAAQLGGIDACVNLIGFMTTPQSLASTSIDTAALKYTKQRTNAPKCMRTGVI